MPFFGALLAAGRFAARGAFAGFEGASGFEGILSARRTGQSLDVLRSTLDRPAGLLDVSKPAGFFDVSKSEFLATRGQPEQEKSASDTASQKSSDSLFSRESLPSRSSYGETGTVTSKTADVPNKAKDDAGNNDSKTSNKTNKEVSKKSKSERLMKHIISYYDPTNFDGRTLALRGMNDESRDKSNTIENVSTRVIRGNFSASIYDFAPQSRSGSQNNIINDALIMHFFNKARQKAHDPTNGDKFHEEFTKGVNKEFAKLKENTGSSINTIRRSESSRDSGKQDLPRRRGANR